MGTRKSKQSDGNEGIYYYEDKPDEKECPECGGSGYDPLDGGQCDRCKGTGVVDC